MTKYPLNAASDDSTTSHEKPSPIELERFGTADEEIIIDPAVDARISKAFDRRVVPWLFGLWLLAFIDRSNIGNARIDGLAQQLGILIGNKFNVALTIFYVPYIFVDVPSNWLVKRVGAGYYLPGLVIGWGVVSTCMGFVTTYEGLLAVRFVLGLMEGGLLGGMIIYLAMFYQRHQLMRRIGLFYCAAPLSGAFGGLLATGLAKISTAHYNGWYVLHLLGYSSANTSRPFIFFVEGGVTVVFGICTLFFLPHTPAHSKFLTESEIYSATHRMKLDAHGASTTSDVDNERFSWHWVRLAIFNINTLLMSLDFFFVIVPIYSFSLFLPTIIKSLGYTAVKANLLTVPPNMAAFGTVILTTYLSDRYKTRGIPMLICASLAIPGYIMLISTARPLIQYGGTFLVAAGIFPCPPMIMGWLANNTAPHYVRATSSGFQICFANCAAFIATFTYLTADAPRYDPLYFTMQN